MGLLMKKYMDIPHVYLQNKKNLKKLLETDAAITDVFMRAQIQPPVFTETGQKLGFGLGADNSLDE